MVNFVHDSFLHWGLLLTSFRERSIADHVRVREYMACSSPDESARREKSFQLHDDCSENAILNEGLRRQLIQRRRLVTDILLDSPVKLCRLF